MTISLLAKVRPLTTRQRTKKTLIIIVTLTIFSPAWPTSFTAAQAPVETRIPSNSVALPPAVKQDSQRTAAVILVKNALLAVNQGNLTGNYTVLRDLSSPGFRERNSAADLAAIFQNIRQQKIDLSPIVVLDPVLGEPQINPDGQLALDGCFASQQMRINFQLRFLKANNGGWMIHGVSINAVPETAAAASAVQR